MSSFVVSGKVFRTRSKRNLSWKNSGKVGGTDFVFTSKPMQLTFK